LAVKEGVSLMFARQVSQEEYQRHIGDTLPWDKLR